MDRLKIGIIGCGALGIHHARHFGEMAETEVVALSDPHEAAIARAQEVLPAPARTTSTDYHDILDAGLDAVCIASPDTFHVPQILDSLAANLHVLCEKPLSMDPDEVEAVIASRDEVGKVVCLTYPRRYSGSSRALRREIQSGKWGPVEFITIYNAEDWMTPNVGTWRHDPALCPGGFFYDANGHQLDVTMWVTGLEAETVKAETDHRGTPVPIWMWGSARMTGGVPMTFSFVGDGHRWREQINIHCAEMDFVVEHGRAFWLQDRKLVPIEPGEEGEHANDAFVRLIREGGTNWTPPEGVWPLLRLTRATLEAAETGREVRVG